MTNSLKTWWKGLKFKNDHIVLFISIIVSLIFLVTAFGKPFTNMTYILLLVIVICVIYIIISGLTKGEIMLRLGRQKSHISFKENRRDFVIAILVYSIVVIIILYNLIKIKFFIY